VVVVAEQALAVHQAAVAVLVVYVLLLVQLVEAVL
jgi:hypothetical protein